MADFSRLPMSHQTRARLTELADQASRLGIDRDAVVAAGPVALRALLALKNAVESQTEDHKTRYLHQVRDALHILEHRSHPELVQQFQARILALQGRGSDTEIAHVARREIVVPVALQSEEVMNVLSNAAKLHGISLEALTVGNASNHINPETGAPEFGVTTNAFVRDAVLPNMGLHSPETLQGSVIPNVNAPTATPPSFEDFRFDPRGLGHMGAALKDPVGALVAGASAVEAKIRTALKYPDSGSRNNEADAFKHAVWNRRMTGILGPERTKSFSDSHEVSVPNSSGEHSMDLYNNRVARNLPLEKGAIEEVEEAFRKGQFRTTPFGKPQS